jgi:hypothetical protein
VGQSLAHVPTAAIHAPTTAASCCTGPGMNVLHAKGVRWAGLVVVLVAPACHGPSEGEAAQVLRSRLDQESQRSCIWSHVSQGRYTDFDGKNVRECVDALVKAGIARPGACLDAEPDGPTCLAREIVPENGATLVSDGLAFHCGDFKLVEIVDVKSTDADHAVVTYEREFTPTPVLAQVLTCTTTKVWQPDQGMLRKGVGLVRAPNGTWEIGDYVKNASML